MKDLLTAIFLGILGILLLSCDGGIAVRGQIVAKSNDEGERCHLELIAAKKNIPVTKLSIKRSFEAFITIAPWPADYFFLVTCPGSKDVFRSRNYLLGGRHYQDDTLDLGRIVLSN